mmetsp:Transcript_101380/g.327174  ORF Transcript_101380/g.327174 Transcript_101380/m.327174 type:complete len:105 (+) Transcript_101380:80-394(+)
MSRAAVRAVAPALVGLALFVAPVAGNVLRAGRYMCPAKTNKEDCIYDSTCAWWNRVSASGQDICVTWSEGNTQPFGSCEAYAEYMEENVFNCLGCGPSTVVECR